MSKQNLSIHDQLGRCISVSSPPKRIISLVPSQTELLFDLGLNEEVVGITKFCIHPDSWFRYKTRVGGTKNINFEKIKSLQPDLIIANKEENEQGQIEQLMQLYPVWISDVKTLNDALQMVLSIGELVGKQEKAGELINQIELSFQSLKSLSSKTCAYFIWKNPYLSAGSDTFINDMLQKCGLKNISSENRYPEIQLNRLAQLQPDVILLSSEPFPFSEKDNIEFQKICPTAKILLVDGEMFSWYGSRLRYSAEYLEHLLKDISS